MNTEKRNIIVGMSGGVDSSVAAYLLTRAGHRVQGIFMKNWADDDPEYPCTAKEDAMDAFAVCDRLGIPFDAVSFCDEYRDRVFALFLAEYRAGRTPNPDVFCNQEIKFKAFLHYAESQGADRIATGHYARIVHHDGCACLLKGVDDNKDQSYFLYRLNQQQLHRALFPLGELRKPEVRQIAAAQQFANFNKKDSTGICFIGERHFQKFLARFIATRPGEIQTPEGVVLGEHQGLCFYTIGQRQGLGIGGCRGGTGQPWFVAGKDQARNVLIVVQGSNHPLLFSRELSAVDLTWISGIPPAIPWKGHAKTRYRQADQPCTITALDHGRAHVVFHEPQRAVTPGQSVVFYEGERCLGGGIIDQCRSSELTAA